MNKKKAFLSDELSTDIRLTRDNKSNIYEQNVAAQFDLNHGHNTIIIIGEFVKKKIHP